MKVGNKEIGLHIDIEDSLIDLIKEVGLKHYPKEFGGVLIGNYSEDKKIVIVSDTILPNTYKSSKYSFERGSEGLKEQLTQLYYSENPKIYVGEWHTHPDAQPIPSNTDVQALNQIIGHDEVNINSPIMLIAGLTPKGIDLGFYVYFKNKIYRYETE